MQYPNVHFFFVRIKKGRQDLSITAVLAFGVLTIKQCDEKMGECSGQCHTCGKGKLLTGLRLNRNACREHTVSKHKTNSELQFR